MDGIDDYQTGSKQAICPDCVMLRWLLASLRLTAQTSMQPHEVTWRDVTAMKNVADGCLSDLGKIITGKVLQASLVA